ncbi:MAG: nucleotidyltransferase domain-containing protein [Nanopusillaceae archaeon]
MNDTFNILMDFSKELIEKVDGVVKGIILFGSYATNKENQKSDVDILILVDDIYAGETNLTITFYFDNLNKILKQEKYSKIHPTTLTLSKFWSMVIDGDPLVLDIIRKGTPIIDPTGIFGTLKKMLENGMIKTSAEYLETMKRRSEELLNYSNFLMIKAFESFYNSVILITQYYLIKSGYKIYGPEDIIEKLEEIKSNKKLDKEILKYFRDVYNYMKKIEHKEIDKIDFDIFKEFIENYPSYKEKLKEKFSK